MIQNMIRAARLDKEFYDTVEHDDTYTPQAVAVVVVASVLSALGLWFVLDRSFFRLVVLGTIAALLGWLVWAALTYWVGTRLFDGTADYGEMLRVTGFAQAPRVLGIIPFLGWIGAIWALVATIVAVREGLDVSLGKAIGASVIGWIGYIVLSAILPII
ncbi:MAG: Yip1 family protein [Acidimicrobiia bacterium]